MFKQPLIAALSIAALHFSTLPLQADATSPAANLVQNPGFEDGDSGYYQFVGGDSKAMNCRYSIDKAVFHTGTQSALMQADDFARAGLGPKAPFQVAAGEHYRVGAWVKAGADYQAQPGSPGVVLRLNFLQKSADGSSLGASPAGLYFAYLNSTASVTTTPPMAPLKVTAPAPTAWTHIEVVVEVPAGVDVIAPVLFFWKAKGSLNIDDFSLEKVDASIPVTPLDTTTPPVS